MLALLMTGQFRLGLAFPGQYRDAAEWIRVTWFGIVAYPTLASDTLRVGPSYDRRL